MSEIASDQVIKTLCGMCPWGCGIKVYLKEGRIDKIEGDPEHPWNRGSLCVKAAKRGIPPCRAACPAGVNVQGYIARIAQSKFKEALELIRSSNPLPGICGRVCFHPCEDKCERSTIDEPVAINALKRFVADHESKQKEEKPVPIPKMYDEKIAVIGSGPSGLAAAYDLARKGYPVTVFESLPEPGGMLRVGIPEYRLPRDILDADIEHIEDLGVEIRTNVSIGKDLMFDKLLQEYKAIFIATGMHVGAKLGIDGEELNGVVDALDFLREANLGNKFKLGQRVAIIGGGNVAIDASRMAWRLGSKEVKVLYRRSRDEMPAYPHEVKEAENEGVTIRFLVAPKRIMGKDGHVTGIECIKLSLGEPDESGRRKPVPVEGSEFIMEVDAVISAVGQAPDFSFLPKEVELANKNTIKVDPVTLETSLPKVFAGGEVELGPSTAIDSIAAGKRAAVSIDRYIRGDDLKAGREEVEPVTEVSKDGVEKKARQVMPTLPLDQRIGFGEVQLGFTEEMAVEEANRCLSCGNCSECVECVSYNVFEKGCEKSTSIMDHVYHPDRLKYPMKREDGGWKRISWDEALETISSQLTKNKNTYGAKSVGFILGQPTGVQGFIHGPLIQRFLDVYGTPNFFTPEAMCYQIRLIALMMMFGNFPAADPENSKCIILWGHNPTDSCFIEANRIIKGVRKGAKLIVVDPRRIPLAKRAKVHVQIRPGTDSALALGMLNVIVSENLYDKEFVEKWTTGFKRLADHVKNYPPEEMEKITWVPAETIREIARSFATTKPACIVQGPNALDQTTSGFQTARAIAILHAITGNIDVPGGYMSADLGGTAIVSLPNYPSLRLLKMVKDKSITPQYPIMQQMNWTQQGMLLADAILTGKPYPIKMLIINGSNPAVTWPNSNKVKQALEKLDFLVVMTQVMSETAELADIVLPAATFLERTDIVDMVYPSTFAMPVIGFRNKVMEYYEAWGDMKFYFELAKKMGYGEYFPWKTEDELYEEELKPTGLSLKDFRGKNFVPYGSAEYKAYEKKGFKTMGGTGKIDLYLISLRMFGYDPLPTYKEPPESPISSPELAKEYPLILTTGSRKLEYLHSEYRNLPTLRKRVPENYAEIHPDTARPYGINDGEMMLVETKRGSIEIKARVTKDILPGVVNMGHGWAKANCNILTSEVPCEPVFGYAALKALLCKIRKKT